MFWTSYLLLGTRVCKLIPRVSFIPFTHYIISQECKYCVLSNKLHKHVNILIQAPYNVSSSSNLVQIPVSLILEKKC